MNVFNSICLEWSRNDGSIVGPYSVDKSVASLMTN